MRRRLYLPQAFFDTAYPVCRSRRMFLLTRNGAYSMQRAVLSHRDLEISTYKIYDVSTAGVRRSHDPRDRACDRPDSSDAENCVRAVRTGFGCGNRLRGIQ